MTDLDIKASDLLQSNSVIWVEGPSDRVYLNKWISLLDSKLIEGYHYSIMFYGGCLLSNITFENQDIANSGLISLLKLNRNCFVIMDRDGTTDISNLNQTKQRIIEELGLERVWVTKGREIENYLTDKTINNWLKDINLHSTSVNMDNNLKLETILSNGNVTIQYNLNKNKYANEIINHIGFEDIKHLNLEEKINTIVNLINKWNN